MPINLENPYANLGQTDQYVSDLPVGSITDPKVDLRIPRRSDYYHVDDFNYNYWELANALTNGVMEEPTDDKAYARFYRGGSPSYGYWDRAVGLRGARMVGNIFLGPGSSLSDSHNNSPNSPVLNDTLSSPDYYSEGNPASSKEIGIYNSGGIRFRGAVSGSSTTICEYGIQIGLGGTEDGVLAHRDSLGFYGSRFIFCASEGVQIGHGYGTFSNPEQNLQLSRGMIRFPSSGGSYIQMRGNYNTISLEGSNAKLQVGTTPPDANSYNELLIGTEAPILGSPQHSRLRMFGRGNEIILGDSSATTQAGEDPSNNSNMITWLNIGGQSMVRGLSLYYEATQSGGHLWAHTRNPVGSNPDWWTGERVDLLDRGGGEIPEPEDNGYAHGRTRDTDAEIGEWTQTVRRGGDKVTGELYFDARQGELTASESDSRLVIYGSSLLFSNRTPDNYQLRTQYEGFINNNNWVSNTFDLGVRSSSIPMMKISALGQGGFEFVSTGIPLFQSTDGKAVFCMSQGIQIGTHRNWIDDPDSESIVQLSYNTLNASTYFNMNLNRGGVINLGTPEYSAHGEFNFYSSANINFKSTTYMANINAAGFLAINADRLYLISQSTTENSVISLGGLGTTTAKNGISVRGSDSFLELGTSDSEQNTNLLTKTSILGFGRNGNNLDTQSYRAYLKYSPGTDINDRDCKLLELAIPTNTSGGMPSDQAKIVLYGGGYTNVGTQYAHINFYTGREIQSVSSPSNATMILAEDGLTLPRVSYSGGTPVRSGTIRTRGGMGSTAYLEVYLQGTGSGQWITLASVV